jgi:hypothetical protein
MNTEEVIAMKSDRSSIATFALASMLTLAGLGGCTTVDQKIGLNYARQNDSLVRHSGEITVTRVELKPFTKNALGEWIIGSLNNVHGVHQADLLSDSNLGEWISDAVLHELRQAGYSVTYSPILPAAATRGIIISDINVLFDVNKGAVSTDTRQELKFNVGVIRNGVKTKTFSVASRDDRTAPFIASKEDKEKIMLHSLQDAMQQIIPDIIELIDKK